MNVGVNVVSAQSPSVGHYLNPLVLLRTLWLHRDLIRQLTWRNVSTRYRGSSLGLTWSFLLPIMMLIVYTFVFGYVFRTRWPNLTRPTMSGFALTLYAGLLLYTLFSETLNIASQLMVGNPNYVKKVVFPLEILPVCSLGAALVHFFIGILVLLLCSLIFNHSISPTLYWFPCVVLPLVFMTLGLSWFLASLGVYFRDVGQIIGIILQVLMFLSPIFYPLEAVPEGFRAVMMCNPLTPLVQNARNILLWGQSPDWASLAAVTVVSLVVMEMGYVWFMKTKRGFADVL